MTQRGRKERWEGKREDESRLPGQRERESGRMSLILESENRDGDGPLTFIDPD